MSQHILDTEEIINSAVFKALGDSTRFHLFLLIAKNPDICACELLDKLAIAQTTLSHHVKILSQADLIKIEKKGRWKHYEANQEKIRELITFMKSL